jgi:hypothetical protein
VSVNAGGETFNSCTTHAQATKNRSNLFLSSISNFQKSCIDSLTAFAADNANLPNTNYTNGLYAMYSDCVTREGDSFKQFYDDLLMILTGVEQIGNSESIMSYLSGVVDSSLFPYVCVNDDLQSAVAVISLYDKELRAAADAHLKSYSGLSSR